ncbi:uncharacterized protein SPSK_10723 [Sporothrix schenckii 1099-18]|uniref:Uncharacterized protein n=1 Tax=Sporothrix schenckii 1099-18 TaxID=1397361 RepID=A0A0F2MJ37_SPOSC|nr:uncharacterized protein SPSK_10723 [Sporothrix schenckii 1099-18]KJR89632.1 hypothetical protein SPSK_10723 [Sporothrix schenckii 1099-18]
MHHPHIVLPVSSATSKLEQEGGEETGHAVEEGVTSSKLDSMYVGSIIRTESTGKCLGLEDEPDKRQSPGEAHEVAAAMAKQKETNARNTLKTPTVHPSNGQMRLQTLQP